MGSFLDTSGGAAAISGAGGILQGLLNAGFAKKNAALNYKYNSMLMDKQNQYNIDAFNRENARQDYLMRNANSIMKQSLQNAGYSTADPNGTGVSPAGINNMDVPSNPGMNVGMSAPDLAGIFQSIASARLMQAQATKVESETVEQDIKNELYAKYGESEYQATVKNLEASAQNQVAMSLFHDQQRVNSIATTEATVKDINQRLDMDWQKLPVQLQLYAAQANEAFNSGELRKAQIDEVYQGIRESYARIQKLMSDIGLNSAQIAVAGALTQNYFQDTRLKQVQTSGKIIENAYNRLQYDVQNGLGVKWHQAKDVLDAFLPIGTLVGALKLLSPGSNVTVKGFGK